MADVAQLRGDSGATVLTLPRPTAVALGRCRLPTSRGYTWGTMSNRAILIAALVLLAAGIVLAAVGGVWVSAVGWGLFGIALVVLVSLAFLLVGESEDRDRMRHPRG